MGKAEGYFQVKLTMFVKSLFTIFCNVFVNVIIVFFIDGEQFIKPEWGFFFFFKSTRKDF